jgi:hypothetical protein
MKMTLNLTLLYLILIMLFSPFVLTAQNCREGEKDCHCIYTYRQEGKAGGEFLFKAYQQAVKIRLNRVADAGGEFDTTTPNLEHVPIIDKNSKLCFIQSDNNPLVKAVVEATPVSEALNTKVEDVQKACRQAYFGPGEARSIESIVGQWEGVIPVLLNESNLSTRNYCSSIYSNTLWDTNLFDKAGGAQAALDFCRCRDESLRQEKLDFEQCRQIRFSLEDSFGEFNKTFDDYKNVSSIIPLQFELLSSLLPPEILGEFIQFNNEKKRCRVRPINQKSSSWEERVLPLLKRHIGDNDIKKRLKTLLGAIPVRSDNRKKLDMTRKERFLRWLDNDNFSDLAYYTVRELHDNCARDSYYKKVAASGGLGSSGVDFSNTSVCTRHKQMPGYIEELSYNLNLPAGLKSVGRSWDTTAVVSAYYCESLRETLARDYSFKNGDESFNKCKHKLVSNLQPRKISAFIHAGKERGKGIPLFNCSSLKGKTTRPTINGLEVAGPSMPVVRTIADTKARLSSAFSVNNQDHTRIIGPGSRVKIKLPRHKPPPPPRVKPKLKPSVKAEVDSSVIDSVTAEDVHVKGGSPLLPDGNNGSAGAKRVSSAERTVPEQAHYNTPWNNRGAITSRFQRPAIQRESSRDLSSEGNWQIGSSTTGSMLDRTENGAITDQLAELQAEIAMLRAGQQSDDVTTTEDRSREGEKVNPRVAELEQEVASLKGDLHRQVVTDHTTRNQSRREGSAVTASKLSTGSRGGKTAVASGPSPYSGGFGESSFGPLPKESAFTPNGDGSFSGRASQLATGSRQQVTGGSQGAIARGGARRIIANDKRGRISLVRSVVGNNQAMDMGDFGLKLQQDPAALYEETGGQVVVQDEENGRPVYRVMQFAVEDGVARILAASIKTVDAEQVVDADGVVLAGAPFVVTPQLEQQLLRGLAEQNGGRLPASVVMTENRGARKYHLDVKAHLDDALEE